MNRITEDLYKSMVSIWKRV